MALAHIIHGIYVRATYRLSISSTQTCPFMHWNRMRTGIKGWVAFFFYCSIDFSLGLSSIMYSKTCSKSKSVRRKKLCSVLPRVCQVFQIWHFNTEFCDELWFIYWYGNTRIIYISDGSLLLFLFCFSLSLTKFEFGQVVINCYNADIYVCYIAIARLPFIGFDYEKKKLFINDCFERFLIFFFG